MARAWSLVFPYATLNNPLCSPLPGCNPMCLDWISPQLFVLQYVWLLCTFLPVTTWGITKVILYSFSYITLPSPLGSLWPKGSISPICFDRQLPSGAFDCFCLKRGVWWVWGNTVRGLGTRGVCVCVVVSELRSRIQGWILDPKWAQHLPLSTTGINQYRCNIVLLSFFWQCFPHIETSQLICNTINWLVSIWGSPVMKKVNKPSHINYKPHSLDILQGPTSDFPFCLSNPHAFSLHIAKPLAQHAL